MIQEQLNHKYDTAIKEQEMIALLTRACTAYSGLEGGHKVVEAVNAQLAEPVGPNGNS